MSSDSGSNDDPTTAFSEEEFRRITRKPPPAPGNMATVNDYQKVLSAAHLQIQQLTNLAGNLRLEKMALQVELSKANGSGKGKSGGNSEESERIVWAASSFALAYQLFFTPRTFDVVYNPGNPQMDPLNRDERYFSEDMERLADYVELRRHLQMHSLLPLLENRQRAASFKKEFRQKLNSERNTTSARVKDIAAICLNLNPSHLVDGFDRMTSPVLISLLSDTDGDTGGLFCTLLFPPGKSHDPSLIFRNPNLPKLMGKLLFGKASGTANSGSAGRSAKVHLWRLKQTTPGLIAATATLAVWAINPKRTGTLAASNNFRGENHDYWAKHTWLERFEAYKKTAISLFDATGLQDLLGWYDSHVFAAQASTNATESSGPSTTKVADQVARLRAQVEAGTHRYQEPQVDSGSDVERERSPTQFSTASPLTSAAPSPVSTPPPSPRHSTQALRPATLPPPSPPLPAAIGRKSKSKGTTQRVVSGSNVLVRDSQEPRRSRRNAGQES